MNKFFLILILGLAVTLAHAVQPVRKPFLHLSVDGKPVKYGDVLTVTSGQKMNFAIDLEGGRRDFCKFPDTYADIAGTAQILARGENGLSYTIDGSRAEWKLKNEEFKFTTENFLKVAAEQGKNTAEIVVGNVPFSQTFVKATVKATWQFSQDGKISTEENVAEATVYFKLAGASDVWFASTNVRASGIKNEKVEEQLRLVQAADDSIEAKIHRLNFGAVQQAIRNLQTTVANLKSAIDEVTASNPAYQAKITFVGLPSDDPYSDIEAFNSVKNNWAALEAMISDLKTEVAKLPGQEDDQSKKNLIGLINRYADWCTKLPEADIRNLADYAPEIKMGEVRLPQNLRSVVAAKAVLDYSQTLVDFKSFMDNRSEKVGNEMQQINSVQSRLPAVRLFDGMLRSYFSSITWADWESTRGL